MAATGEKGWLHEAVRLHGEQEERLWDVREGAYFELPEGAGRVPKKDGSDASFLSGNGIAALNLIDLSRLTGERSYRDRAERLLAAFARAYPDRCFDVGIAEQHAVTSAAGFALGGLHPVVAIYATFLNRAFDQVLLDVALHKLPVTFVLDRAGVTGSDGPSHNGMWDGSILQVVPGLKIAAPRDATRLAELLREAVDTHDGPTVLRFPKGAAGADVPTVATLHDFSALPDGSHYMVWEYIDGENLAQRLRARGTFAPRYAVALTIQALPARWPVCASRPRGGWPTRASA